MRVVGTLQEEDRERFCLYVFEALWSGEVDPTDANWLEEIARLKDISSEWLLMQNEDFEANTHAALKSGAFGVPSFVLHAEKGRNELFFGVDHMALLARTCKRA